MKKKYCLISLATVLISLGTLIGCGDKTTPTDESTTTSSTENKEATNAESNNKEDNSASKENNIENKDSLNKENSEDKANTANNDKDSNSSKSDKDSKATENSNESKNTKSNENKGTDSKKEKSALPKTKSEYFSKMQEVDNKADEIGEKCNNNPNVTQAEMNSVSYEQSKLYDDELNKIYKFLKQNLSTEKFKELEKSEVEWINQKEKRVESIKKEFEGGSMLPLQVNSAVAEESKNRCYYLINNYME
ncbi:lysozyme inhibitor LprI family protein [Clostridium sp. LIBA-8841]|uniref:lysozyme inhibitor LprI family protein n=1 Tax=Clostridium sp. LIBA-8841 TaxID=2987530 RepID=UPI002AC47841|nr:lysozyme inhibitor LprI family protein [Clostridium sp. LIBA-8841]MDZ5253792.1 DUF1311 domain-containing protein [Clostridium sp. LIBA-8841]